MSLEDAIKRISNLNGVELTVGLQGEAASGRHSRSELVAIGTAHEFGLGVPIRAFMRTSLKLHGKRWVSGMRKLVSQFRANNKSGAALTLRRVGVVAVGDVQKTIRTHNWEPNAPSTIAQKGPGKPPLIDSTQMIQSIRSGATVPGMKSEVVG